MNPDAESVLDFEASSINEQTTVFRLFSRNKLLLEAIKLEKPARTYFLSLSGTRQILTFSPSDFMIMKRMPG